MENLDLKCAELGRALAEINDIDEKLVRDALAVLEEQGVYAFFLYLKARGKAPDRPVNDKCRDFLKHQNCLPSGQTRDVFADLQGLATNLDDLLFARDLLRQALVYARYHVKAKAQDKSRT